MQISGSTVLLTGATGGIGRAIAKAVADRGGRLIVTGRRGDMLEQLAADYGGRALTVDLAVRDDVERLAREAGEVDILIANAGLPASGTLESFTVGEIDRALDVNLRAPMMLAKALAPAMVAKGRGHLLFVSSLAWQVLVAQRFACIAPPSTGCADSPGRCAPSTAIPVWACRSCSRGSSAEAGMFADANVDLPRGVGTQFTRRRGARCRQGNRAKPRRGRCRTGAAAARLPASRAWRRRSSPV